MTAWQPIETAPKDGSVLLVCEVGLDSSMTYAVAFWGAQQDGVETWFGLDLLPLGYSLTHWMPLPEPPKGDA
jgi:hypothetical protein